MEKLFFSFFFVFFPFSRPKESTALLKVRSAMQFSWQQLYYFEPYIGMILPLSDTFDTNEL